MKNSFQKYCKENNMGYLLDQWVQEKNEDITPDLISFGSNKKVWWRCGKGHEWQAQIKSRLKGGGCPICKNRVLLLDTNDLGTTHPEIAAQWHPVLNGELTPNKVTAGSSKSVWWKCDLGHTWKAIIYSRTAPKNPTGCPVCAGKGREHYQDRYSEALKEE